MLQHKKEAKKFSNFFEGLPVNLEKSKAFHFVLFPLPLAHEKKTGRDKKGEEKDLTGGGRSPFFYSLHLPNQNNWFCFSRSLSPFI